MAGTPVTRVPRLSKGLYENVKIERSRVIVGIHMAVGFEERNLLTLSESDERETCVVVIEDS